MAAEMAGRLEPVVAELAELAQATSLAIGGRAATEALATRIGAKHLSDDPVAAAEHVSQTAPSRV